MGGAACKNADRPCLKATRFPAKTYFRPCAAEKRFCTRPDVRLWRMFFQSAKEFYWHSREVWNAMREHMGKKTWLRRLGGLCAALLIFVSAMAQGSYAWTGTTQTATNIFLQYENCGKVRLVKYEKDTQAPLANAVYDLYKEDGTRMPGRYTTDVEGVIVLQDLAPGEYFLREVRTPYGYNFADTENALRFTVQPNEEEVQELRAENIRRKAALTIRKEVEGQMTDPAHKFTFNVWVGTEEQTSFAYRIYDAAGVPLTEQLTLVSGQAISLSAGEFAVVEDIPVGSAYSVREVCEPGYEVASTGASGTILEEGSTAVFRNTVKETVQPLYGALTITKEVEAVNEGGDNEQPETPNATEPPATETPASPEPPATETPASPEPPATETPATPEPPATEAPATPEPPATEAPATPEPPATETPATPEPSAAQAMALKTSALPQLRNASQKAEPVQPVADTAQPVPAPEEIFRFTVWIGNDPEAEYTYTVDGGAPQTLRSGDTLELRAGQSAVFDQTIPAGTWYEVVEQEPGDYNVRTEGSTGTVKTEGSLARFVNTPERTEGEPSVLRIHKMMPDAAAADENARFAFRVRIGSDPEAVFTYTVDGGEAQRLKNGEVIWLAYGQTAEVSGLTSGTAYAVTEEVPAGYSCSSERASGTLEPEGTTAIFRNTLPAEQERGSLTIGKTVVNGLEDADQSFDFVVTIGEDPEAEYPYIQYSAGETPQQTSGVLKNGQTVSLRNGEKLVFADLEAGLTYCVEEKDTMPEGYVTSAVGSFGTITAQGVKADFENRYVGVRPEEATILLQGTKQWDHGDTPDQLRPQAVKLNVLLGETIVAEQTVTAQQEWKYSFDLPRYQADGVTPAEYTLREEPVAGYTASYGEASADEQGNITQDVLNTALVAVYYTPTLQKELAGDEPPAKAEFVFELKAEDAMSPLPEGATDGTAQTSITGAGTADFGAIRFDRAGSYSYTIRELPGSQEGYTYDESVYRLLVEVEEQGGALVLTCATMEQNGKETEEIRFVNRFENKATPEPTQTPQPTDRPEPTQAPQPTDRPEPTGAPVPTSPAQTPVPKPVATERPAAGTAGTGGEDGTEPTPPAPTAAPEPETQTPEPEQTQPPEEYEDIDPEETPLAGGTKTSWALLNLILMIPTVLSGLASLLWSRSKEQKAEQETATRGKRQMFWRIAGAVVAIASVVAFFLTEDMQLPMVFVDRWTILMALLAVIQIVALVLRRHGRNKQD